METIQKCKNSKIRCSVIGLAAEMFICKHLCQETGGTYSVALDEVSLLIMIEPCSCRTNKNQCSIKMI
jgi:hypothetical protein